MATARKILTGANGGQYYFSDSHKKVYLKKKVTEQVASQPPPSPPSKRLINHIAILIDESGSMGGLRRDALEALNNQLTTIRNEAFKMNQITDVSILKFNTFVQQLISGVDSQNIQPITAYNYTPTGQTALLDAVGEAIERLDHIQVGLGDDVSYLLIVITDGEENASRRFAISTISDLINKKQATDRWSFVFSVPRGATRTIQHYLRVPAGNIQEWDQTSDGVVVLSSAIAQGTQSYYSARSIGKTATKNFFTTDLSKVDPRQIKAMNQLNGQFKKLPVVKEVEIRPFVEAHGFNYEKGRGFYELTKPEDVQDYKDLILMDKSNGKLYGGSDSRLLIGMPTVGTTRVKPGNHMNYSIFVKSTSVNRKLVRGTTLLYNIA